MGAAAQASAAWRESRTGGRAPTGGGNVTAQTLDRLAPGVRGRVVSVADGGEGEVLGHLSQYGITAGVELVVEARAPFGGPIVIRMGRARLALGRAAAAVVRVVPTA